MEGIFKIYQKFNPVIMIFEIIIVQYLFSLDTAKRKNFGIRMIFYAIFASAFVIFSILFYDIYLGGDYDYGTGAKNIAGSFFNFILYIAIFVFACIGYYLCYKQDWQQVLACTSVAYAVQHIVKNMTDLFSIISFPKIWTVVFQVLFFVYSLTLLYFYFIKKYSQRIAKNRKNKIRLIISLSVIFICIGMSRLTSDNMERNQISLIAESIYAIVCCLLVLGVQFGFYEVENKLDDINLMQQIISEERKQYELSKATIDLINMKCHNLKYQISTLKKENFENNISSIEHAVMIYDCTVKTGNEVLDIILTEKKLQCENKKICMTCEAGGKEISFMDTTDIYTLFGNILSNAVESVCNVEEEDKRFINVSIKRIEETLFISVENYYKGQIVFENNLPVTNKDKSYHGFGMKSIERIVNRYDGELNISTKDNIFCISILFPIK